MGFGEGGSGCRWSEMSREFMLVLMTELEMRLEIELRGRVVKCKTVRFGERECRV